MLLLVVVSLVLSLVITPSSGLLFFPERTRYSCIKLNLRKDDMVIGELQSLTMTKIGLKIQDSDKTNVTYRSTSGRTPFSFVTDKDEYLEVCVRSEAPPSPVEIRNYAVASIKFKVSKQSPSPALEAEMSKSARNSRPLEIVAKVLEEQSKNILHLYTMTEKEDSTLSHTNELTVTNLYVCSVICLCVAFFVTMYQVVSFQKYLVGKRIIR